MVKPEALPILDTTINRRSHSRCVLAPTGMVTCILLYVGTLMHLLSAVTQCTNTCHFFWKYLLTSPECKQHPQPQFFSPLKHIFIHIALSHGTGLLHQGIDLAHCQVSLLCMSYNTDDTRYFLFYPVTTLVRNSAGLFSDLIYVVNDSLIATDSQMV